MSPFCPDWCRADPASPVSGAAPGHERSPQNWKLSGPQNPSAKREMKFFPNFLLREMMAWYVAMGALGALAALFPWNLGRQGRSFCVCAGGHQARVVLPLHVPDAQAHPVQSVVRRRGGFGCTWLSAWPACSGFCCLSLRVTGPRARKRGSPGLAVFALAYVIGMSVYGYLAK